LSQPRCRPACSLPGHGRSYVDQNRRRPCKHGAGDQGEPQGPPLLQAELLSRAASVKPPLQRSARRAPAPPTLWRGTRPWTEPWQRLLRCNTGGEHNEERRPRRQQQQQRPAPCTPQRPPARAARGWVPLPGAALREERGPSLSRTGSWSGARRRRSAGTRTCRTSWPPRPCPGSPCTRPASLSWSAGDRPRRQRCRTPPG